MRLLLHQLAGLPPPFALMSCSNTLSPLQGAVGRPPPSGHSDVFVRILLQTHGEIQGNHMKREEMRTDVVREMLCPFF